MSFLDYGMLELGGTNLYGWASEWMDGWMDWAFLLVRVVLGTDVGFWDV